MQIVQTTLRSFQGQSVPVRIDGQGNEVVSLWANIGSNAVAFCDRHAGRTSVKREGGGWVACTYALPLKVEPREGLEDGRVGSLESLMAAFFPDSKVLSLST